MTTDSLDETSIATVERDGGAAPIDEKELSKFKDEIRTTVHNALAYAYDRRETGEQVRLAIWEGQSRDGRKHEAELGIKAIPYEGSPDARLRVADMIVNEHVLVACLAAIRSLLAIKVSSLQTHDPSRGARLTTLLKWILKNQIGRKTLRRVLEQLANYCYGDSPGVGFLGVWQERESALEDRSLDRDEVARLMVEQFQLPLPDAQAAFVMMDDPAREDEAVDWMMELLADVPVAKKRAREIVRDLRDKQTAMFPAPYWRQNGVCWHAYRMFEDIFVPSNTPSNCQRARWYLIRESISEAELKERQRSHAYTEKFVQQVLEKGEGRSILFLRRTSRVTGDGSIGVTQYSGPDGQNPYQQMFEVLTLYFRAVNDQNVPGVYYFPLNLDVAVPGHGRELLEYNLPNRCVYPFIDCRRESLNNNLLDSRGVPELAMTDQDALKLLDDSRHANAILKAMPPYEVPNRTPSIRMKFNPLGMIKVSRRGEIGPIEMPDYPVGITEQQGHIWDRLIRYHGLHGGDPAKMPPLLTQMFQQWRADKFGDDVMEACSMTLALAQQYMSDEELAKVCDKQGFQIARSREEIQGEFGIELDYDVRSLDMRELREMAQTFAELIAPLDKNSTIQYDQVVNWFVNMLNPNMAEMVTRPVEDANSKESGDERNNIAQIAAGLEPDMAEQGQNWQLRLGEWQKAVQKDPQFMQDWTPLKRKIAEARMEHLEKQYEQHNINPGIGRSLGKKVMG